MGSLLSPLTRSCPTSALHLILITCGFCLLTACSKDKNGTDGSPKPNSDPGAQPVGQLGDAVYWLQDTSHKVQPTSPLGPLGGDIRLEGPRDSVESYQIVLSAKGGGLRSVTAQVSNLNSTSGGSIPADNVVLFRQYPIDFGSIDRTRNAGGVLPAPENSPTGDSRVPDPLIPLINPYTGQPAGAPFNVASDTNQPLWLDVRIPKDALPGLYQGEITFRGDGLAPFSIKLSVDVWDLTLPDSRNVTTFFKINWPDVIPYHDGMDTAYPRDNPKTPLIVKRYQELAHTHRVDPRPIWVPYPNGCEPPSDWGDFDAVLGPYLDGSHWDDGVPSTYFGVGISVGDPNLECNKQEYIAVARAWSKHLKEKGWFEQSWIYAVDEPAPEYLPVIAEHSSWLQEADPDWKSRIIVTTAPQKGTAPWLNPAVGVYVLCFKCFDSWEILDRPDDPDAHVLGREEWPGLLGQGIGMWFYESIAQIAPYPGFATNTLDAAEPRIGMWGSWYEGASGFLYYSMTHWDAEDPWGPSIRFPKTGDGVLIYPGHHNGTAAPAGSPQTVEIEGPVPSIRLKMVRSGLQDWALFKLAAEEGLAEVARREVEKVYRQFGGCGYAGCNIPQWYWKTDYTLMAEARRNVAQAVMDAKK